MSLEKHRRHIEEQLTKEEEMLSWMLSNKIKTQAINDDGKWIDTTQRSIKRHEENIQTYRDVLRTIDTRIR